MTFLVRYGEIGLKGVPVRRRFESILIENITRAHSMQGISCIIEKEPGRLFVSSEDPSASEEILRRSFGVVSLSDIVETSSDIDNISARAVEMARELIPDEGASFAVRARRTGNHEYTSMELASILGSEIQKALGPKIAAVSLSSPKAEIFVEVRNKRAFLFRGSVKGPGGLPVRSQGRVLSVIEDEKSLLSTWLMLRRGCNVVILNRSNLNGSVLDRLKPWNPWWGEILENKHVDLDELLNAKNCEGIVLGWDLEEFNSRDKVTVNAPIFYPLIGMKSDEIESRLSVLISD